VTKEVQRETWEIEAEQGLLTEGGRRRARAAAAAAEAAKTTDTLSSLTRKPNSSGASLINPQYYSEKTSTLTLPPSAAAAKGHSRAFSHASSGWPPSRDLDRTDIALPTPTLPLAVIASQPFAQTLKILKLSNRRLDVSLALTNSESDFLPNLEELNLEGCGLRDTVPVLRQMGPGTGTITPPRTNEPLLPLLAKLFPNLQTLDLSDNALTAASVPTDVLSLIIVGAISSSPEEAPQHPTRKGLKHLRLRGNRLADVGGLQDLAERFKGNRTVPGWKLEELDLRDNEIGRLPPELGLLPLDIFLVDGNV
jgi:Leucine-rich repeat (LRR) protein